MHSCTCVYIYVDFCTRVNIDARARVVGGGGVYMHVDICTFILLVYLTDLFVCSSI